MNISVVLQSRADRVEKFAAKELAEYISLITGEDIPIVEKCKEKHSIHVGQLPESSDGKIREQINTFLRGLHSDGFVIKSINGVLFICGKTARGTLYGVYHYLQMLGVRWYFPGKDYEFLPNLSKTNFIKPLDVKESPDIAKRGIVIYFGNNVLKDWVDFAPKVKLNNIALHSHEGINGISDLLADRGLNWDLERHFFGEEYDSSDSTDIERNKKLVRDYISKLPDSINDFFLWQADGWLQQHDYDKKHGYNFSDSVLQFMNEMVSAVRDVRPDGKLAFLAYLDTWHCPKFVKPAEGIFLEVAPIHRCFAHSVSDSNCPINSAKSYQNFGKGRVLGVKPVIEELLELFNPQETQVLGYWLDASLFGRGRYEGLRGRLPQFGNVIKRDINYYRSVGIKSITTFAVGLNQKYFSLFTSPAVFQYPSLLWDSQSDLKSELSDFCERFYGEREMADAFRLHEQFDPSDTTSEYWKAYIEELSSVNAMIREISNDTDDKEVKNRLEKLLRENEFVEKWIQTNAIS